VAFGLIWLGGLLDDTSCVLVYGGFYEVLRITNAAACFTSSSVFAEQMVIGQYVADRHVACARAATQLRLSFELVVVAVCPPTPVHINKPLLSVATDIFSNSVAFRLRYTHSRFSPIRIVFVPSWTVPNPIRPLRPSAPKQQELEW
jgi:hypothetical protein